MEKVCSVCGAPMIRIESGYKCSFCAHSELPGECEDHENGSKWTTYTSYTETEDTEKENPLRDFFEKTIPQEKEEAAVPHDDVMVEVPMGNAPKVDTLSGQSGQTAKNKPVWKKIIKIYIIVMVAQAVIPTLVFFAYGLFGNGLFSDSDDFKITIDKSKFPVIHQVEVPDADFEMPEIEINMPDIEFPDFSYLDENMDNQIYIYSAAMRSALSEMFGKPAEEVTKEELQSIQYFMIEVDEERSTMEVKYSTEDYSLYPEDYSEEVQSEEDIIFGYSKEFEETIQTITVPFEKDLLAVGMDIALFENVKAINICKNGYVNLSNLPQLTMLDAGELNLDSLFIMNMPTDQIEVLRLNTTFLNDLERLTGLKNLHIDGKGQIVTDLSVLSNMPWLEELTIKNTFIGNLDFLEGIPELRSLRLINNNLITDKTGLDSLENLENLIVE